jgi:hypothetical protein
MSSSLSALLSRPNMLPTGRTPSIGASLIGETSPPGAPTKTRVSITGRELDAPPLNIKSHSWKIETYQFGEELCNVLDIDSSGKYTCDEIKNKIKSKALTTERQIIISNSGGIPRSHKVYTFPDKIAEYLNRILTEKCKMDVKMSFISRIIYDVISLEKIKDQWSNFECAVKIENTIVDCLDVVV